MKIQVLGTGCSSCKQLLETVKKVVTELEINGEVEYITDVSKIIEMGVMTTPALAINGKPILTGGRNNEEDVKNALQNNPSKENQNTSDCSCGGKC